ncbi:aldehyde dehydrogenase family protein [Nocardia sp. NBC_01329]|uniref:aldehyde dehydrogenase family protein n=1 Tax=Nocardia sp. NBC_01329 TaxID=2903594 RepID=UPI003FA375D6
MGARLSRRETIRCCKILHRWSTTGAVIAGRAAAHITRVALELGGKNPHIIFTSHHVAPGVGDDHGIAGSGLCSGGPAPRGIRRSPLCSRNRSRVKR